MWKYQRYSGSCTETKQRNCPNCPCFWMLEQFYTSVPGTVKSSCDNVLINRNKTCNSAVFLIFLDLLSVSVMSLFLKHLKQSWWFDTDSSERSVMPTLRQQFGILLVKFTKTSWNNRNVNFLNSNLVLSHLTSLSAQILLDNNMCKTHLFCAIHEKSLIKMQNAAQLVNKTHQQSQCILKS